MDERFIEAVLGYRVNFGIDSSRLCLNSVVSKYSIKSCEILEKFIPFGFFQSLDFYLDRCRFESDCVEILGSLGVDSDSLEFANGLKAVGNSLAMELYCELARAEGRLPEMSSKYLH